MDSRYHNQNNDSNLFVNLSHLLLSKITNGLIDNIDRVCLSLVCKRLYNERHKYLSFSTRYIKAIKEDITNEIYLNSYKSILINSINQITNCTLLNDKQKHIDKIASNVNQLDFSTDFSVHLEVGQSLTEKIY
ncbi:hypothetical protein PPL_06506 [Heterostelium album PN500]|uniref:Uncharacterized protein n=1 Tax=Heterostelium pallidum (strain ATCC 26659 / Pp 5 / PN500) TaxID=670386 RepID=D3BDC3_HETP5|nr:hypothetical protein PPL_06506 [Heterostelium album PN500]EFA80567.1 hypothetical protein PPL_06506 [Heterostelium album PN500]|eukprot:XP_020432687.1 hypothetical protein PPL_06506 [Heterostelium album PN500]